MISVPNINKGIHSIKKVTTPQKQFIVWPT